VFGMVKDDRHRTRALVTTDGREIGIVGQPAVFAFIGTVQEEVHRYAITTHRKLRGKKNTVSQLDEIPGVGEVRKAALWKTFGSLKAIRNATEEELGKAVPPKTAKAVYAYFHQESGV